MPTNEKGFFSRVVIFEYPNEVPLVVEIELLLISVTPEVPLTNLDYLQCQHGN